MSGEDEAFRDSVFEDSALQPRPGGERADPGARRPATTWSSTTVATTGIMPTRPAICWSASTPCALMHDRLCLISVGEVTVTMDRTPGAGGRNQQFALACALELENYPGERLTVLSAGSDGIDGNTQIGRRHRRSHHRRPRPRLRIPSQGVAGRLQRLPHVHRSGRLRGHRSHRPQPARPAPADR